ncbi:MAG: ethylbenzene dehydrogenase, partial [Nitrospinae bacterium]|nr:ethylbenzene dehydrogenase [Nitrospinota bacterium]
VLQPPTESNADIKAYGAWKDGVWTLEMSRALDTKGNAVKGDKKIDVRFDPAKTYHFGISVFDNAEAMDHSFSGPLTLTFKK